jgi:hypothetical protein
MLNTSKARTYANHMVFSVVGFTTLCTPWMSNLGCNRDLQKKMFVQLMNALCCYKQTLPWPKVLTNYFDDSWLCTINIVLRFYWHVLSAHLSRGGKLMTISPSHLKVQRVTSRTLM